MASYFPEMQVTLDHLWYFSHGVGWCRLSGREFYMGYSVKMREKITETERSPPTKLLSHQPTCSRYPGAEAGNEDCLVAVSQRAFKHPGPSPRAPGFRVTPRRPSPPKACPRGRWFLFLFFWEGYTQARGAVNNKKLPQIPSRPTTTEPPEKNKPNQQNQETPPGTKNWLPGWTFRLIDGHFGDKHCFLMRQGFTIN